MGPFELGCDVKASICGYQPAKVEWALADVSFPALILTRSLSKFKLYIRC